MKRPDSSTRPATWANPLYSQPSLAMGYEWMTSAVQLADGYVAIADGGQLLEPALVHAVRDGAGAVTWQHHTEVLRQAISPAVAAQLVAYLGLVTDSGGTGTEAQLDRYKVYGKTGTAEIRNATTYHTGHYRASFAGMFPGNAPRWVIYVMLDRPRGVESYGGKVAAPVVRSILQQALALEHPPFDLGRPAVSLASSGAVPEPTPMRPAALPVDEVAYPLQPSAATPAAHRAVPTLANVPVREATLALHELGFQVRLVGRGRVRRTDPVAGDSLPKGAIVTIVADTLP